MKLLIRLVVLFSFLHIFLIACDQKLYFPEDYPEIDRHSFLPVDIDKQSPSMDEHPPILHSSEYKEPIPLPGAVNTSGAEDSPFILPDGNTLYFFFTPDVRIPHSKQLADGVTGVYVAYKNDDIWGEAEKVWLAKPGILSLDGAVSVQGDEMWFVSIREGFSELQVFTAVWLVGRWQHWQPVGDRLMKEIQIGEVHLHNDDLYFHSDRPGGLGGYDIWKTNRNHGEWSDPINIQAVNSEGMDGFPCISPDGNELWFTRTVNGTPAIFRSKRAGSEWSNPEMILSQFSGEPSVDANGNIYFVHHYFKNSKMIEADIYVAYKK